MEQNVWLDVCRASGVPDAIANEWLHKLMIKYSHENRHYYKWDCFNVKVNYLKRVPHHIIFAVFFQYYEVNVKEDCAKSNCDAFREFYNYSEIDFPNLLRYVLCLLGDSNYTDLSNDIEEDLSYFKDLDLLILGVPQKDYDEYTKLIQKEYRDMNENDYKMMRLKILETFLKIPFIYSTEKFRDLFEEKTSPCTKCDNRVASTSVLKTNEVSKDESVIFIKDVDDGDSDCEIIENTRNCNVIILDDDAGDNMNQTVANQIDNKHEEEYANNKTVLTNSELFFKDTTTIDDYAHCLNQAVPLYTPLCNSQLDLNNCNSDIPCLRKGVVDLAYKSPLLTLANSEANLTNISISDDSSWNKSIPEFIPLALNSINTIPSTTTVAQSRNNNNNNINTRQHLLPIDDIIDLTAYSGESPIPKEHIMANVKNKVKKITSRQNKYEKQRYKMKSHRTNYTTRTILKSFSNTGIDPLPQSAIDTRNKRLIIIDGSNVAFMHSCNNVFSAKGIAICIKYFEEKGFKAQAVVPQHRLRQSQAKNCDILHRLHREHKVILTPCKKIPGKFSSSYDDRFILEIAAECNGVIISNDNYCDLMDENSTWKTIIETRVVGYTFFNDLFMLPDDPYGRDGPKLATILYE